MTGLPTIGLDFTSPPPVPGSGIERVNELLVSGRLFRCGETEVGELDVAELETAFARLVGSRSCVAFNSSGAPLAASLMALGVGAGEPVLRHQEGPLPLIEAGARILECSAELELDYVAGSEAPPHCCRLALLRVVCGHGLSPTNRLG
ncbi:MAG: DegT/DnrJ/EryC1/StrS family aminotransferase [Acidimicrobiaceae bacterium]|nr:DegT/DnrJ/EryC1/StrS family aminotransferase [Acidimicrobiia bacterium]MCY4494489.1 DegT/DnrJ/EryC1/StrS family aminotransferase [Acidimicrobiaceae bacterium]